MPPHVQAYTQTPPAATVAGSFSHPAPAAALIDVIDVTSPAQGAKLFRADHDYVVFADYDSYRITPTWDEPEDVWYRRFTPGMLVQSILRAGVASVTLVASDDSPIVLHRPETPADRARLVERVGELAGQELRHWCPCCKAPMVVMIQE